MQTSVNNKVFGGFWARFTANWIDLFIVSICVRITAEIFNSLGVYIPLEITVLISLLVYSSLLVGWKGRTIGKALCGLTVSSSKGTSIGFGRAFLREAVCKIVSAIFFFLGFIWIAFSKQKRGWHDIISRTIVKQDRSAIGRAWCFLAAVVVINIVLLGPHVWTSLSLYGETKRMAVGRDVMTAYSQRDPLSLIEVGALEPSQYDNFIEWLNYNSKEPVDYAVDTTAKHQVTIFGEHHYIREELSFLNRIIPELYHRAGVTCIAMECCVAEDNARLAKLVTSAHFDSELAIQIARHEGWKDWGSKGYWDVFETVWKVNRALPEGSKKMRIIGIDSMWDGPSFALMGVGDEGLEGPSWEKLRIVRLFDDAILILKRDELMARNIEKEIIEKKERGLVWVGANHSFTRYRRPRVFNGKVINEWSRMGFILHQKYGDQVFQIILHNQITNGPNITGFMEMIANGQQNASFGFDLTNSPFARLRDNSYESFHYQPGVCLADLAGGYIYLKPLDKLEHCQWISGYISREMFVENKPYYEAKCGRELRSAKDANKFIAAKYGLQFTD